MFYSDELLTGKKGKFGIIWLAATLGPRNKKISRKDLTKVDLAKTCDLIAEPPEPMALRLSGALLVGVARVYNQNYDIFYSDVTNFHSNLRRSIATDFATNGTGTGGTTTVDLPGGGKSKLDQISFPDLGLDIDIGLDMQFHHIDWNNPIGIGRKRRSSSMLSSQATQESTEDSDEEDEEDDENQGSELGRDFKRKKVSSSPAIGTHGSNTRIRNSIHHPSETTGPSIFAGIENPMGEVDLGLDFDGVDGGAGNDSFSAPSGRGFELPMGDENIDMAVIGEDLILQSRQGSVVPDGPHTPPPHASPTPLKSALKRKEGESPRAGSDEDVEKELEVVKKKVKKAKKVTFDSATELDPTEDKEARKRYQEAMKRERGIITSRVEEKAIAARATALVDGTAGLQFFDPEMNTFFSTFTQVPKFKWETDLAAHKLGKPDDAPQENGEEERRDGEFDVSGGGDENMPMAGMEGNGYQDVFQEYEVPIQEMSASVRQGSATVDPEHIRRASQGSQQGPLPWEERPRSVTPGFADLGDTSFSPASLKLSHMTPQEARLRSRSTRGSLTGPPSLDRRRHRSSSLMSDRPDNDPLLLVQGDDLELPGSEDDEQLESLALSQQARLADLPAAFRPEMLATLEKQCRDFFTYVERKMLTLSLDELDFEDLAPVESKKHVAALAFYDCLTLATKKILSVEQEDTWGPIKIRFAVDSD